MPPHEMRDVMMILGVIISLWALYMAFMHVRREHS